MFAPASCIQHRTSLHLPAHPLASSAPTPGPDEADAACLCAFSRFLHCSGLSCCSLRKALVKSEPLSLKAAPVAGSASHLTPSYLVKGAFQGYEQAAVKGVKGVKGPFQGYEQAAVKGALATDRGQSNMSTISLACHGTSLLTGMPPLLPHIALMQGVKGTLGFPTCLTCFCCSHVKGVKGVKGAFQTYRYKSVKGVKGGLDTPKIYNSLSPVVSVLGTPASRLFSPPPGVGVIFPHFLRFHAKQYSTRFSSTYVEVVAHIGVIWTKNLHLTSTLSQPLNCQTLL